MFLVCSCALVGSQGINSQCWVIELCVNEVIKNAYHKSKMLVVGTRVSWYLMLEISFSHSEINKKYSFVVWYLSSLLLKNLAFFFFFYSMYLKHQPPDPKSTYCINRVGPNLTKKQISLRPLKLSNLVFSWYLDGWLSSRQIMLLAILFCTVLHEDD